MKKKKKEKTKYNLIQLSSSPRYSLTEEQLNALNILKKIPKQVQTLGGYAGSGKTTLVSVLYNELKGFACCAFTGKAADVLRSKGIPASTVHSLMYNIEVDDDGKPILENGNFVFTKKDDIEVKGIIVDEASMIGNDIYNDLISYNVPIIFVGDHGQLEPVGEDVYLMKNPDIKLETIHRNAGEIARFAFHIRNGNHPKTFEIKENNVEIIPKLKFAEITDASWQVICAYNSQRVNYNKYLREKIGMPPTVSVGDKVISLRNSRKYNIFNGTQLTVKSVRDGAFGWSLKGERNNKTVTVPFNQGTFNQEKPDLSIKEHPFDYAYAITCHKSQGSEWDKVAVLESHCDLWDYKRWAYTAASRAKKQLLWVE